jgi:hypothetical protein
MATEARQGWMGRTVALAAAAFLTGCVPDTAAPPPPRAEPPPPVEARADPPRRPDEKAPAPRPDHRDGQKGDIKLPPGVPRAVGTVLNYIDEHDKAPEGYEGGRTFRNLARDGEQELPRKDDRRRPIGYREWDIHPHRPGVNRGAERLVTGSDGSAYFTRDHYRTFIKIR